MKVAKFYAELCCVCNELKVCGQECLSCKLDSVMDTYHTRIIADNKKIGEMSDKLKVQGKLLSSGVVITTEEYSELLSSKDKLEAKNKVLREAVEFYAGSDCDETGRSIIKDGILARQALEKIKNPDPDNT